MRYSITVPGTLASLLLAIVFAVSPAAHAQDNDISMDVVESEKSGEEAVSADIALPESAAPEAHENAAYGLATANEARNRGREFGQDRAAEAREAGRDSRDAFRDAPDDRVPENLPGRP